jgi:hypothetical protein
VLNPDPSTKPQDVADIRQTRSFAIAKELGEFRRRFDDCARHIELGLALCDDIAPPGAVGDSDKSGEGEGEEEKFRKLAEALKKEGIEFSGDYLREHRDVAWKFRAVKIFTGMKWSYLLEARDPETLEDARKWAGEHKIKRFKLEHVVAFKRWRAQQDKEKDRNERPELRGRNQELERAINQFYLVTPKIEKLIDKALNWIEPHVDKLSDAVRHELIRTLTLIKRKIDAGISMLEPSKLHYRDAAE